MARLFFAGSMGTVSKNLLRSHNQGTSRHHLRTCTHREDQLTGGTGRENQTLVIWGGKLLRVPIRYERSEGPNPQRQPARMKTKTAGTASATFVKRVSGKVAP